MEEKKKINSVGDLINFLQESGYDVVTPQYERTYNLEINWKPETKDELETLIKSAPKDILKKMGVGIWTTYDTLEKDIQEGLEPDEPITYMNPGDIHYLFPGEWYNLIPEGFECVDIFGEKELFSLGKSDDDIRFGCLGYGFVRNF